MLMTELVIWKIEPRLVITMMSGWSLTVLIEIEFINGQIVGKFLELTIWGFMAKRSLNIEIAEKHD